jgi:type IV pilus assembly protein PilN
MRIALNLATRPFADLGPALRQLRIAMGVLALLALGLWFGIHTFHQRAEDARAKEAQLDRQIAAVVQERQSWQSLMQQPENASLINHIGVLNQLFDEKGFSWTLALADLEEVLPAGVQAVTLEPQRDKTGKITLRLRVSGPRDKAVELVRNLEHSRYFLLPRIVGESAESSGGPGQKLEPISASSRVNFDLLADYNAAALAERRPSAKKAAKEDQTAASKDQKIDKRSAAGPLSSSASAHLSKPAAAPVRPVARPSAAPSRPANAPPGFDPRRPGVPGQRNRPAPATPQPNPQPNPPSDPEDPFRAAPQGGR